MLASHDVIAEPSGETGQGQEACWMARHVNHQHICGFAHICVGNRVRELGECQ